MIVGNFSMKHSDVNRALPEYDVVSANIIERLHSYEGIPYRVTHKFRTPPIGGSIHTVDAYGAVLSIHSYVSLEPL